MKLLITSFALALTLALGGFASAHDKHKHAAPAKTTKGKIEFIGKGDGVTTCPVTGEEIQNKDVKAVMFGRTVYFCCPGCMDEAKKTPAAYLKPTHKAQLAAIKNLPKTEDPHAGHHAEPQTGDQAFLGKGDGVETCPVTGEPVNKNLKGEVNGREFFVCCEGCIDTVKKNPSAYLKPVQEAKKETSFLGKGDGIETCPVTGEPVDKTLKSEVNGQTFYVCCAGCIDTVKKNPDAYLKKAEKK